jgi:3-hydroxyisobutyrate dehydrogenase-like beta-hydroxyacid dehydrogenase
MKVGFIGLGQMGKPMAMNLVADTSLVVFDQARENSAPLVQRGASCADGLGDFAQADVIFLSLPNSKVVETVVCGEGGLIEIMRPGVIVVDTSTIEYGTTLTLSERLCRKGIEFIDAPVSGMQTRAEEGTLTMMCGGKENLIEQLNPLFSKMASSIVYMGAAGSGQLAKLINQLLFDINTAALAEILPMAVKLGLEPETISKVINSGTGGSYASEFFIPNILKNTFDKGYPMANAYKDLISGAEISARYQVPTPVLAAATATYQQALLAGHGMSDKGAMIKVFENLLGVEFRARQE